MTKVGDGVGGGYLFGTKGEEKAIVDINVNTNPGDSDKIHYLFNHSICIFLMFKHVNSEKMQNSNCAC